jgi:cell division protease FtsH
MVTRYGMSETFGMMALQTSGNSYLGDSGRMTCSSETARLVDEEVRNIIAKAHSNAKKILEDNKDKMDELAEYLIDKETITGQEFMRYS